MKIELKCIHFNYVSLSLASIIFRILSVAFGMLTLYILNKCTCFHENRDLECNLNKNR